MTLKDGLHDNMTPTWRICKPVSKKCIFFILKIILSVAMLHLCNWTSKNQLKLC